ncbi:hypothetical protein GCM10027418_32030 [Mariniluteicoccus endophyticus]
MEFAGTHSWEIFDHVPNEVMGRMPARVAEQMRAGAEAGGDPAPARPSATVVPLREVDGRLQVWMMRRRATMKFGGVWAFPGGKLEPADEAYADPLRACAVRELAEECGCTADPGSLLLWARWLTPEPLAYRFDTWFYQWFVPEGTHLVAGDEEAIEGRWLDVDDPGVDTDDSILIPATRSVLSELALLGVLGRVTQAARGRTVEAVTPRYVRDGDRWRSSYPLRSGEWQ